MSETHSDLNLLFGVVALQMDFLTRDQLVDALNRWAVHKDRTLGELLVEEGVLAEETRTLLAALVQKHVDTHGRVEDSLAACTRPVPRWSLILDTVADQHLQSSLHVLAATEARSDSSVSAEFATEALPGGGGDRYEILRSHARGGLGEVFVARDVELNRDVAVKAIKPRLAGDAPSCARFLMEAEITGRLQPVGVVPVYGLGRHSDGRPYYAMRFIRGQDMKSALGKYHVATSGPSRSVPLGGSRPERKMELRKLLARFIDVCETMEYAHSRGIVHRDLKPSNIMLGEYGETLVVDWGLAKPVGTSDDSSGATAIQPGTASSGSLSVAGTVLGTPMFMSPEQAAGHVDELGRASDVYSLGATLYNVLTGRAPFERGGDSDHQSVLDRVQRGEFPPPRAIDRRVPAALDAICLKAMATRPADRYLSARELSADVERWLADEPVGAYVEPVSVRVRRWVARHRTAVYSMAAAVLVALLSLAAFGGLVSAKNRELASTNGRLVTANARERSAAERAAGSAQVAREQTQLALATLNSVIFNVQEKLKNIPGGLALRAGLLRTALEGLAKVESSMVAQSDVDLPTAEAYSELGQVFMRVGNDEGLGGLDSARRMFDAHLDMASQMIARDPEDLAFQLLWAVGHENMAHYLHTTGRVDEAHRHVEEALQIRRRHAARGPGPTPAAWALSNVLRDAARMKSDLGRNDEALECLRESAELAQALKEAFPGERTYASAWMSGLHIQSRILGERGRAGEFVSALEQIRDEAERQVELYPGDPKAWHDLADANQELGDLYLRLRRVGDAYDAMLTDLQFARRLYELEPHDLHHRRHLAMTHTSLGRVCLMRAANEEGLEHLRRAVELCDEHLRITPRDAMGIHDLSIALERLVDACVPLGMVDDAANHAQRLVTVLLQLVELEPASARSRRALALAYNRLGNVSQIRKDHAAARGHYESGLAELRQLSEADPDDVQIQRDLTFSYNKIGDTFYYETDLEHSLEFYERALDLRRRLSARFPDDPQLQQDLGVSLERLGNIQFQRGHSDQALTYFNESLEVRRRQMERDADDAEARRNVATTLGNMGILEQTRDRKAEAVVYFDEAIALLEDLERRGNLAARYAPILTHLRASREACLKE